MARGRLPESALGRGATIYAEVMGDAAPDRTADRDPAALLFVGAERLVLGDDHFPVIDLVVAAAGGWSAFGRCCEGIAGRAGITVIRVP